MTKTTKRTRKAFDMARDSVYVPDPITQLCIQGGKGVLADDEAGDLDTVADDKMNVDDLKRLRRALRPSFKRNIEKRGVKVPIIVIKIGDVMVVLDGKSRVRALRAGNRARTAEGLEPFRVRCVTQRDVSPEAILDTMVTTNNGREEDDFFDKLEKLGRMKDQGRSDEDCADAFNVKPVTIKGMLAFMDNATDETKQAVKDGRLQTTAAAEVAREKDPDEQRKLLAKMLAAPERKARGVKAARAARGAKPALPGKRDLTALLTRVQGLPHPRATPTMLARWEGVEELLKHLLSEDSVAEWLMSALTSER